MSCLQPHDTISEFTANLLKPPELYIETVADTDLQTALRLTGELLVMNSGSIL